MLMDETKIVDILLIEDNPQDIEITLRSFKKLNIANKIFVITDGEEALDYLFCRGAYVQRNRENSPKIIILDLKLPKVSGAEILRQLKADDVLKIIPVIVLTSSQEERDVIKSYKYGANSYIVKPVDYENFMTTVKELGFYWLLINQQPYSKEDKS